MSAQTLPAATQVSPRPMAPFAMWMDPATGETSDTPRDGWELLELDTPLPIAPAPGSTDALAEWYGEQMTRLEADIDAERERYSVLIAKLEAMRDARLRSLEGRAKGLAWMHQRRIEEWARSRLTGKRRSLDTTWARFGFRRSPDRREIRDEGAVLAWAAEHLPEAIVQPDPYVLRSKLPKDRAIPGVEVIEGAETFYVSAPPSRRRKQEEKTDGE